MIARVRQGVELFRNGGLGPVVAAINRKDTHLSIQFVKYSLCGGLATSVHVGIFYLLALTVLPTALDHGVAENVRRDGAVLANVVGFPFSNTVAYLSNALWVFTGGRHSRLKEFLLFNLVSALSFGAGLVAGPQLIRWFGISTHLAQCSFVASSALANFALRKLVIFRR